MRVLTSISDFSDAAGQELGVSGWLEITQARIDAFAEVTGDHQWIHTDPVRAAAGPFGATIAHGFLTLALIPALVRANYRVESARMAINYGLNKVRFVTPVTVGSRVRARTSLARVDAETDRVRAYFVNTVEIEARDRPACVAEGISVFHFD
jgi:acyl dehydratase